MVNTVTILTCDRPQVLRRAIDALTDNLARHGRTPLLSVFDDSSTPQGRSQTIAVVDACARAWGGGVEYVGHAEKAWYVESLVRMGFDPSVVGAALLGIQGYGPVTGANRNMVLLRTHGELVVSLDDDIECQFVRAPDYVPGVTFDTGRDPCEYRFYPDRAAITSELDRSRCVDLIRLHEELLGREVGQLLHPDQDVSSASGARDATGETGQALTVPVTMTGLVGDCGWTTPRGLWMRGRSRQRCLESLCHYYWSMHSREVLRVASQMTVSTGPFCMTASIGLDNRRPLPPFCPTGRNQDGIFGAMVRACEFGMIGHLPWAILHSPPEPRTITPEVLWKNAASYDLSDVIGAIVRDAATPIDQQPSCNRMAHLTARLRDLTSRCLHDFEESIASTMSAFTMAYVAAMEASAVEGAPAFWQRDWERLRTMWCARAETATPVVPREFANHHNARARFKDVLTRITEVMTCWPALVEATAQLHRTDGGPRVIGRPRARYRSGTRRTHHTL